MFFTKIILLTTLLNPFLFDVPEGDPETTTYLESLEKKIQNGSIHEKIEQFFIEEKEKLPLSDQDYLHVRDHLFDRIARGIHQKFTSDKRDKGLIKINKGGEQCVVTTVDLSGRRNPALIKQIAKNLQKTGFNGYLYYRIGGFPHPRGTEIKYASIPYSFKIFLMEEAYLQGFSQVLWLDSRLIPIRSIQPIFDALKKHHGFFVDERLMLRVNFLSQALESIENILEVAPLFHKRITTPVFGLDFSYSPTHLFLEDYYLCAENGLCFLSVFPEEHVISSILAKYKSKFPYMSELNSSYFRKLWFYDEVTHQPDTLKVAKKHNYFFYGVGSESQYLLDKLVF
ncbi:MAG: hypothetical protein ACOYK9_02805 [Chlamydiia bacterium]